MHLALALWLGLFAGAAVGPGVGPLPIRLVAYVDHAPPSADVLREIRVFDGDAARELLVVSAMRHGAPETAQYFERFREKESIELELFGDRDVVAKLLDAPAGAKVIASVVPYGHDRRLLVGDVEIEAPEDAALSPPGSRTEPAPRP